MNPPSPGRTRTTGRRVSGKGSVFRKRLISVARGAETTGIYRSLTIADGNDEIELVFR
jgi:hypothetical protein